jgi:exodeoxyribonuclease VII small subunit
MRRMSAETDGREAAHEHADWTFEAALDRLTEIVERIESDALELDEALALFEEGVRLLRFADTVLEGAETRISQLLEDTGGGVRLEPMPEEP